MHEFLANAPHMVEVGLVMALLVSLRVVPFLLLRSSARANHRRAAEKLPAHRERNQ